MANIYIYIYVYVYISQHIKHSKKKHYVIAHLCRSLVLLIDVAHLMLLVHISYVYMKYFVPLTLMHNRCVMLSFTVLLPRLS